MPHETSLLVTVAVGLGVAFLLGALAVRLRLPPLVGYLIAGTLVGPFAPGYLAGSGMAAQVADIGVILLMFGVGLHFSIDDIMKVQRVVVPGALLQIVITGSLSIGVARAWGWNWGSALVVGLALSVASTVVMLKGLEARDRLDSSEGRIAIGWLVVEDLAMVLALVLLPALAPALGGTSNGTVTPGDGLVLSLGIALLKVTLFAALMFVVGRRAVPWVLERVAKLDSRELFTLAVLALALGIGTLAASVFGVSTALGAFFAGAVISESELSHRAATEALPLQDAFAVLFFVSVGMLFDPRVIGSHAWQLTAMIFIVLIWKMGVAFGLVRFLKQPARTALTIGSGLAQIGEFSFIVTGLGVSLGILPEERRGLVVAAALIAITLNQPMIAAIEWVVRRREQRATAGLTKEQRRIQRTVEMQKVAAAAGLNEGGTDAPLPFDFSSLKGHVVIVGYGRVGSTIAEALQRAGLQHVVIEEQERVVGGLRRRREAAIHGDATREDVLARAGVEHARLLIVTAPEPFRARRIVEVARGLNPTVVIGVRTHSAAEQSLFEEELGRPGAPGRAIYAEREVALGLAHYTLTVLKGDDEADRVIEGMRLKRTMPTETFAALHTREYKSMLAEQEKTAHEKEGGG